VGGGAPGNLQAEWARLLIGSLADAGVREVVVSPGSRSTPFVLAAAAHPQLTCFDVVDERAAAFFALGRARVTGRPALLLCTSGTAGANYLPAVVEAGMAHLPLLVLTADRPVELAGCGANQTIDQLDLYGDHARRFFDLGAPDAAPGALRALRRAAAQAAFATRHPEPGAVHLNARARKPLEPQPARTDAERALADAVARLLASPVPRPEVPRRLPPAAAVAELAEACRRTSRGLVVCGPAPVARAADRRLLARLGELTGFPVYAEPASQSRFRGGEAGGTLFLDALDPLLHGARFRELLRPELIVQLGRTPTSGAWDRHLAGLATDGDVHHWVLADHGWPDGRSTATRLLFGDPGAVLAEVVARLEELGAGADGGDRKWRQTLAEAEEAAWRAVDAELAADPELSEGKLARAVADALPDGALLVLGNSLPIRQVDAFCRGPGRDLRVACQRGASGIDGVVAGAAGAATAWTEGPTALLVGDVSFLHDLTGLAAARFAERPFVVVVAQNRGGRIFEQLPLATDPAGQGAVLDHWTTPHDHDLAGAAALYHLPFERATTPGELDDALRRALDHPGATVVEAVVPPHGAAEESRRVRRRVESAVTEVAGGSGG